MAVAPIPMDGAARFIADLAEEGLEPTVHGGVVTYYVVPATGARAGQKVITGVSVSELQGWPMAPPHWVHLEDRITFAQTNADTQECLEGWRRHSRDTGVWDMSRKPVHLWIGHVRCVLGQVI
jgi:hypothetical protein